ncbi:MAG: Npun_F0494 family protein [Cyanobacteria bacterium P01_H01_bin.121]
MTSQLAKQRIEYPSVTVKRAERAACCSPFNLMYFEVLQRQSVPLLDTVGQQGVQSGYLGHPLSELLVENELLWLVRVGLLRREVDGQGITDSFRLTPLGHQLVHRWQDERGLPAVGIWSRICNLWLRWLRALF